MKLRCDNCGKETFLVKKDDLVLDGGYTRVDAYEEMPEGWKRELVLGKYVDLCTECANSLQYMIRMKYPNIAEAVGIEFVRQQKK